MRNRDDIYHDILARGRGRAESAWLRGNKTLAAAEKAHLALIPGLLHCDDLRRHRHYLEVDCLRFLRDCKNAALADFNPLWAELNAVLAVTPQTQQPIPVAKMAGPVKLDYHVRR
jgi:hypothetical protein